MSKKSTQIIKLAKQRVLPKDIAEQLGVERGTVYEVIRLARRSGEDIPPFRTWKPEQATGTVADTQSDQAESEAPPTSSLTRQIVIPNRLHALLHSEAERRGKSPVELAQKLLEDALLGGVRS
tara:strand:- start:1189 stop:1557 length:369 start_codon:yes stop_codon:yes gene_type:complete